MTALTSTVIPAPIVVNPSNQWDGNDGPWSSFTLQVGTPAQQVRVLVSTAASDTQAISAAGACVSYSAPDCVQSRGGLFDSETSSTWAEVGQFALITEQNLGYAGNQDMGDYGFDTVGLSSQGNVSLDHMVVGQINTTDYFLGNFGLDPWPVNFTDLNAPNPSFITALKSKNLIPSLSYGYTAGARYRSNQTGSLTLGGYDASRFTPNSLSFTLAADISRDLIVGLQSLIIDDSGNTNDALSSSGGILMYIDSTIPHLWLPLSVCKVFEQVFGLTWYPNANLYLLNETQHNALIARNASFSFALGNSVSGGQTINITLPYASFDLVASYPLVAQPTRYFPLIRAANETQYTLGRTFLQEAYLIADYERSNFSVSSAIFDDTPQTIVAILANNNTAPGNDTHASTPAATHLPTGALAGIIAGGAAFCLVAIALAIWCCLKRNHRKKQRLGSASGEVGWDAKAEIDGRERPAKPPVWEMNSHGDYVLAKADKDVLRKHGILASELVGTPTSAGGTFASELPARRPGLFASELPGSQNSYEMEALPRRVREVPGIHEAPGPDLAAKELPAIPQDPARKSRTRNSRMSYFGFGRKRSTRSTTSTRPIISHPRPIG